MIEAVVLGTALTTAFLMGFIWGHFLGSTTN